MLSKEKESWRLLKGVLESVSGNSMSIVITKKGVVYIKDLKRKKKKGKK